MRCVETEAALSAGPLLTIVCPSAGRADQQLSIQNKVNLWAAWSPGLYATVWSIVTWDIVHPKLFSFSHSLCRTRICSGRDFSFVASRWRCCNRVSIWAHYTVPTSVWNSCERGANFSCRRRCRVAKTRTFCWHYNIRAASRCGEALMVATQCRRSLLLVGAMFCTHLANQSLKATSL